MDCAGWPAPECVRAQCDCKLFPCQYCLRRLLSLYLESGTVSTLERKSSKIVTANSPLRLEQSLGVTVLGGSSYNVLLCLNSACLFRRLNNLQPLFPEARDTFYKISGSFSLVNIKQSLTKVEEWCHVGGVHIERLSLQSCHKQALTLH